MSKYTVELGTILQAGFPLNLDSYPIFDEAYRDTLNTKIIQHFWWREIGFETAALFSDRLAVKMNEIMPYYNQLYKSEMLKIEPLITHYLERKYDRTSNTSTNGSISNNNKTVSSDTPQGLLSIGDIENEVYASNADISNSTTDSNNARNENIGDTETIKGNTSGKSNAELLMLYRKSFINIDMMVIDELEELFMQIWG
nr:MAG TPA: Lower collar protein [Caudoviricetes sp.]